MFRRFIHRTNTRFVVNKRNVRQGDGFDVLHLWVVQHLRVHVEKHRHVDLFVRLGVGKWHFAVGGGGIKFSWHKSAKTSTPTAALTNNSFTRDSTPRPTTHTASSTTTTTRRRRMDVVRLSTTPRGRQQSNAVDHQSPCHLACLLYTSPSPRDRG